MQHISLGIRLEDVNLKLFLDLGSYHPCKMIVLQYKDRSNGITTKMLSHQAVCAHSEDMLIPFLALPHVDAWYIILMKMAFEVIFKLESLDAASTMLKINTSALIVSKINF